MDSFYSTIKKTPENIKSLEIGKPSKNKVYHIITLQDGKVIKLAWEDDVNYDNVFSLKKLALQNLEYYYNVNSDENEKFEIVDLSKSPNLRKAEISPTSAFKYSKYLQKTNLKLQSQWKEDIQELKTQYPTSSVSYKHPLTGLIHINITPKTVAPVEQSHPYLKLNLPKKNQSSTKKQQSTKK